MIIQKGNFFRFVFKNKFIFLNLSLIILIFCAVFARVNGEKEYNSEVYLPVQKIETESNVYSLTINLSGGESEKDVKLLSQVLKGFKTKATFFTSTEWLEKNSALVEKIQNDGHYFGLIIDNGRSSMSRDETMYFLASENDRFFHVTSYYPSFVRIENDKSGKIPELLNAFGQKYVSSSITLSASNTEIKAGDIVSVVKVDSETPYYVAEFVGKCSNSNYVPLSLENLFQSSQKNALS